MSPFVWKGGLLWDQINRLLCYAWNLCEICDFTCCSKNPKKHLPYLCEFNDNEILSSYAKGVYINYDIEQIEEFFSFRGAYEVASLIESMILLSRNLKNLTYLNIAMKTMRIMSMSKNLSRE